MMAKSLLIFAVLITLLLPASSLADNPSSAPTVQSTALSPTYATSFTCNNGNTPVQNAVCGNRQLAVLDLQLAKIYQAHLGTTNIFERDQLLAAQRAWLLSLPIRCGFNAASAIPPDAGAISCLSDRYREQIAQFKYWPEPEATGDAQKTAMTQYVDYKLFLYKERDLIRPGPFGFRIPQFILIRLPNICSALADRAAAALSDDGAIDPTKLDGARELAGSHAAASGPNPQPGRIFVDLYQAGLYGGYQMRARSVALSHTAPPLLGQTSVGDYVRNWANGGGRFVSLASQTGDYGNIDVFTFQGQLLALMTDTIGYNSPAPPGEAAVAAVFTISQGKATPACLFETYLMPPPLWMGAFAAQPSLTPFLTLIDSIQGTPPDALAPSDRQDSYYFLDDTRWTMFNMPLLTLAQAKAGNWAGWLRRRHDQVLDTLYAWSQKSGQNQSMFNNLFALMRPAAADLQAIYVQQQGLTASQAEQATALAMMELLYQATINIAPELGGEPADPSSFARYQPKYAILVSPQ
jgi:uncharacterized protein YecT (DUF1311 family)